MTCQVQCAIRPAPTEIIDESDLLVEDDVISLLKAQGIEVRDFASLEERRKAAQNPAIEIFDPYRALAKFEHKLDISSKSWTSGSRWPISGKVIQRLLDIGWISEEEIERRCIPADIQALREYRKKLILDAREGWGIYPWRALRWDSVPMVQERRKFIVKYGLESVTESNGIKERKDDAIGQSIRRLIIPPSKQYPAPLSSYDPTIYPEAAAVINSRS